MMRESSILDPIHATLTPALWDNAGSPKPSLKPRAAHFIKRHIYTTLEQSGYSHPDRWLRLFVTGSLTTYQYGSDSDCDVSLFVGPQLPEWSRAEMIGVMTSHIDGTLVPGTSFPLQDFVVAHHLAPADLYKPGLRSGYDLDKMQWFVPPEPNRAHDVEAEQNGFYVWALEQADKMERLLRYEPHKAVQFWHQIHRKRQQDQRAGKGDYSESNILYKFLAKRNLLPAIAQASGEHIAKTAKTPLDQHMVERLGPEALDPYESESYWNAPNPEGAYPALPRHVYRSMSEPHFQESLQQGWHQSDERSNYIDDQPEGTVAGRWAYPGYLSNAEEGLGRIVKMRVHPDDGWENHPDDDEGGYVRTFNSIPTDRFEAWTDPIDWRQWRPVPRVGKTAAWNDHFVNQINPIADAYDSLPDFDPNAVSAWQELAADSHQRANQLRNQLNISETDDPEPYANAHEMFDDINRGNFAVSRAHSEHPIWTPDQNVDFRIVHDVLGHHPTGGDFGWQGENLACGNHFGLLSPNAQQALMTECLGQTGAAIRNGGFGPQKVGLMNQLLAPAQQTYNPTFSSAMPEGGFCHRHLRHGIYRLDAPATVAV